MKFTAQEEYGLRCILALARAATRSATDSTDGFLTVSAIAESEGLSEQYAGKLIRILGKAGMVESVRGCKGGYRLALPAEEISVAEIIAVLGGKIYEPDICERYTGARNFCVHTNDCSIRSLWSGLQRLIDKVLSKTSLQDLIGSERSMTQWVKNHTEVVAEWFETNTERTH